MSDPIIDLHVAQYRVVAYVMRSGDVVRQRFDADQWWTWAQVAAGLGLNLPTPNNIVVCVISKRGKILTARRDAKGRWCFDDHPHKSTDTAVMFAVLTKP